jgi:DNA-binding NarL/FixJ family response regulator
MMMGAHDVKFQGAASDWRYIATPNPVTPSAVMDGATLDAIRGLTPRQREVLSVMMQGKCNKAICRR